MKGGMAMKNKKIIYVSAIIGVLALTGGLFYFNHQNIVLADSENNAQVENLTKEEVGEPEENEEFAQESVGEFEEDTSINLDEYKQYESYGLKYDKQKDRFYYNGKMVRYFKDQVNANGKIIGFSYSDGEIDIISKRDSKYQLKELIVQSKEDFDQRTKEFNESFKELDGFGSFEEGFEVDDDSLAGYESEGIKYEKKHDAWSYNGRIIRALYDQGYKTYLINDDIALESNLALIVNRDKSGNITSISEMAPEQFKSIFE